ncbi:MAG: hypothetical protein JSU92_14055 [Deltaproteobacteria bacterium]|nr:MAG: hypothetical protein JSU92_14055 [Deltaproteobacteria bacterium]
MRLTTNFRLTIGLSFLFLIAACAAGIAYYRDLNDLISRELYPEAVHKVEQAKNKEYKGKNAVLYYMDKGLLHHLSGQWEESNQLFESAEQKIDELYTKSISKEAASFLTSDNVKPYDGEDFERVLINLFRAFNYVYLGQPYEALVEARKVDHKLNLYNQRYGKKNVYKEDALVRYLMGMLYENQGEINDAFISYRKALETYHDYAANYKTPIPRNLVADCLRTADSLGFREEKEQIQRKFPKTSFKSYKKLGDQGELIFIHYNGIAPHKIDNIFEMSFGKGWGYVQKTEVRSDEQARVQNATTIAKSIAADEHISIAFPKYVKGDYRIKSSQLSIEGKKDNIRTRLVEDITAIAFKDLEDRINRIRIKTIARAAVKFALAHAVGKAVEDKKGEAAGKFFKKLTTVVASATEKADKRSWRTLPAQIRMARVNLEQGNYNIKLSFMDKGGTQVMERTLENVKIEPRQKTFVSYRTAL